MCVYVYMFMAKTLEKLNICSSFFFWKFCFLITKMTPYLLSFSLTSHADYQFAVDNCALFLTKKIKSIGET